MGFLKRPKAPPPPEPIPAPEPPPLAPQPVAGTPQAERPVATAQEAQAKLEQKRRGRSSTILNGQVADGAITTIKSLGAPRTSRIMGYGS